MKRLKLFIAVLVCVSGVAAISVSAAQADPNNGGTLSLHFFDCTGPAGTPISFDVVVQAGGVSALLTNGTGVFLAQSNVNETTGQVLFQSAPGLTKNGRTNVTCTYIGPVSGDTFLVTGFLAPVG